MAILAQVFEQEDALAHLEAFTSHNGPDFYRLPRNSTTLTLSKSDKAVDYPKKILSGEGPVTVFDPGFPLFWQAI